MKFAKELEIKALPKWRSQYIRYKALKKVLKAVEAARQEAANADAAHQADARNHLQEAILETSKRFITVLQEVSAVDRILAGS